MAAAVALIGLGLIARISAGFIGWFLIEKIDTELRFKARAAAERVLEGVPASAIGGPDLRVLDTAGRPSDGLPVTSLRKWELNDLKAGRGVSVTSHADATGGLAQRWVGEVVPSPGGQPRLVLAGTGLVGHGDSLALAGRLLWAGSIVAAGTVGIATWLVVRRSLRPVERMRTAAAELPEGERLPVPLPDDELRALAEALNGMLARRDAGAERLRRFTGDAAHELRNPVSSIRAQAEVAVLHPNPDLAQETLRDIADEAKRMSDLVEGLLTLAKAESQAPAAQPVDLVTIARAAADRANLRGSRPRVQVVAPTSAMVVRTTPAEITTVLDNLLTNAMRYARATVRVSLVPTVGAIRLMVDDDGEGIPEEHRERVFDRFHRVQLDRARSSGGAGLGLALVAEAVRRRGGAVRAGVSPEGGARIEVRWPRASPGS